MQGAFFAPYFILISDGPESGSFVRFDIRMQAAVWFGLISTSCGTICRHSSIAKGHRVWKGHPDGGFIGEGTSPFKMILSRLASISGSGIGTADINARVYGISGSA